MVSGSTSGMSPVRLLPLEREDHRQVRVAEEADRPGRGLQRTVGIDRVEDVVVLVERRAVADLELIVDLGRALRQLPQVFPVVRAQLLIASRRPRIAPPG